MYTMIANRKKRALSDIANWFKLNMEEMRELKLYAEVSKVKP